MRARSILALALAAALAGCTVIVTDDLGQLEPNPSSQRDLAIRLIGFDPHVGQRMDLQIVDPMENFLQARAVIDTLPSACVDVRMRRAAPLTANRLDFYADLDMDGVLDPPPEDHVWRCDDSPATPCAFDEDGRLTFPHNFTFQDITENPAMPLNASLVLNVSGAEAHDGESVTTQLMTEVPVDEAFTEFETSVPGLHYLSSIESGTVAYTLPGIVDGGRTYDIELTFGDGTEICILREQRAPTSGDFVIEVPLSEFECSTPEPVDCAALQTSCDARDDAACETLFRRCAFVDCGR